MQFARPLSIALSLGLMICGLQADSNSSLSTSELPIGTSTSTATPNWFSSKLDIFSKITPTGYLLATGLVISLYLYTQLNYKKTQPKRIYPAEDASWQEWLQFIHNEYLVGQKYYPDRQAGFHMDEENPEHFICEYTKIEARGLAGQTHYYMNNVVIPTAVLLIAFNTFKKNLKESWDDFVKMVFNPASFCEVPKPADSKNK